MKVTLKPETLIINSLTAFFKDVGNQFQVSQANLKLNTEYVVRRVQKEGLGFVTKTLPKVGKAFDASLRDGRIHPMPVKTDRRGSLPLFLKGLINLVFEKDGTLLDKPDVLAIRYIRQICFMFYKLEGDYPKSLVNECIENFVTVDAELHHCSKVSPEITSILYEASQIIGGIFRDFDCRDIIPRPGPGQTADKRALEKRYEPGVLYNTLHQVYPYYHYFYNGISHLRDSVHSYRALPRKQDGYSVLATVPKDSRGPRIICMEPSEYMWLQQGLGRKMMEHIENQTLTRGHVNFTDQTINGGLALCSSSSGDHATLDMKEASDRISKDMIDYLFMEVPDLRDRLLALSTKETKLPNGEFVKTNKFAPMGSALCFPVMSVVHFALALSCMKHESPERSHKALAKDLYVFGDDIICHSKYVQTLFENFPIYGLKFNQDKSFFKGKFRESCGVDAYDGVNVSPQRIKSIRFLSKSGTSLVKHLAYYHGLKRRGMSNLALVWRRQIEYFYGDLPYVTRSSGVPGWIVPRSQVKLCNTGFKWSRKYQTWVKRVRIIKSIQHASMIGTWERLLRTQVHCVEEDSSPLYKRLRVKLTWKAVTLSGL